jgi:hypothetical protein
MPSDRIEYNTPRYSGMHAKSKQTGTLKADAARNVTEV